MCCFTWLDLLLYKKEKIGLAKRESLASNATVHPPIKILHDKAAEAIIEFVLKKESYYFILIIRVTLKLAVLLQHKFTFLFIFQTFLKLTTRSFTINTMQFTVCNNGTQWILDFGPVSVVLSVKDLDENLTISSLEIPLAALFRCCPRDKNVRTVNCFEFP